MYTKSSLIKSVESTFTSSLYPVLRQTSVIDSASSSKNERVTLSSENNFYSNNGDNGNNNRPSCRGPVSGTNLIAFCPKCKAWKTVTQRCHLRNCANCAFFTSRRLYHIFYPSLQRQIRRSGNLGYDRRLIFGVLTYGHVPAHSLGQSVRDLVKRGSKFLRGYFPLGALIVAEHTYYPSSHPEYPDTYYLHLHFLAHGYIQNGSKFYSEWGRRVSFDDASISPGSKVRDRTIEQTLTAGMNYLLKYVTKGAEVQDKDLPQIKRVRYVTTVGKFNRMDRPKYLCKCKKCSVGIKVSLGEDAEDYIEKYGECPILELEREITWSTRSVNPVIRKAKLLLRPIVDAMKGDKWKFIQNSFYNSEQSLLDVFDASMERSN